MGTLFGLRTGGTGLVRRFDGFGVPAVCLVNPWQVVVLSFLDRLAGGS